MYSENGLSRSHMISGGGNNIASGNGATISGGSYLTVPDVGGYAP